MRCLTLLVILINAVLLLGTCSSALAVLGEAAQTVDSDAQPFGANAHALSQAPSSYTIKEFTTPAGISVREYVSPDSIVFGVAWNGPHPPDIAALLGSYFADYKTMAAQASGPHGLHHQSLRGNRLVIETGGHMRDMWGRAWDPQLLPSGVTEEDIR
jgi:hypothetical protein